MEKYNCYDVALAALLHDIGKIPQRYKGKRTNHWKAGEQLLKNNLGKSPEDSLFIKAAAFHHASMDELNRLLGTNSPEYNPILCIQIGDHISAQQRRECEDDENSKSTAVPMVNPFSTVAESDEKGEKSAEGIKSFIDLVPLNSRCPAVPKEKPSEEKIKEEYQNLEKRINSSLSEIARKYKDVKELTHAVFSALQTLVINVPSAAYYSEADISLFAHLHSTAAISSALWHWWQNAPESERTLSEEKLLHTKAWLLLGVDVSGIQKFIFSVTNKGAAKLVKARSFLVAMIPHILAHYILDEFDLPPTQILYAGGGNLFMLLPNTGDVREKLKQLFPAFNRALYKQFAGMIQVVYAHTELCGKDFGNFADKWREIHDLLGTAKRRKYQDLLKNPDEVYTILKNPFGKTDADFSKTADLCEVCRIRRKDEDDKAFPNLCRECRQLMHIGQRLRNCTWIAESWGQKNHRSDKVWKFEIGNKTVILELFGDVDPPGVKTAETTYLYAVNEIVFDDTGKIAQLPENARICNLFYGGTHAPVDSNGEIRTFGELAGLEETGEERKSSPAPVLGPHRYGVLRLDVDNLGWIFAKGIAKPTIDRISTLSLFMDLFFSLWLPTEIEGELANLNAEGTEYEDAVNKYYILYSGGDDMFIVGSWDIMPHLAGFIREKFGYITGENPKLTLSGGLAFFPPKFPIREAAKITGNAEDEAKSFKYKVPNTKAEKEKDTINIFGVNVPWCDYKVMKAKIGDRLKELISREKNPLPKSFLQKLYSVIELYENHLINWKRREKKEYIFSEDFYRGVLNARWTWMAAYFISRYKKNFPELDNIYKMILNETDGEREKLAVPPLDWLKASVIWADWTTRKERK